MRWLTPGGLVAACGVGFGVAWGLGWPGLAVLAAFFLSGSLLTQLAERRAPSRNARQVLANGGVAAVAALLGSWSAAAGAIAAAAADTWATEIGAFSPLPPRLVTSGRRVTRGTSGGITALGTLGGVAGATLIAGLVVSLSPRGVAPGVATLVSAGVAGMLADSLLGATLQGKYECPACDARFERGNTVCHEPVRLTTGWRWLDNDAVNFAATLIGAAIAAIGAYVLR
ncbi:MAG TPA: DUF92 domain-containing protein [Gemmatimonadales bacterium]|nr:DUF92 domain-containing protein [Gemmatimonadales bacterium]